MRVFVSYRRDDVPDATDRLTETLKNRFGDDHVWRFQDPDDYVRLEIEAALCRKVRVVPLLRRNAKTLSRELRRDRR